MQSAEPTLRQAARVLVIDPAGRVLLLEGFDPAEPDSRYWITIGGGLDDGEEAAQAALRERWEEAGIVASWRAPYGIAAGDPPAGAGQSGGQIGSGSGLPMLLGAAGMGNNFAMCRLP
jgi:8-oxo-dGTP pyrophosphatase MutT (NUDIX family)